MARTDDGFKKDTSLVTGLALLNALLIGTNVGLVSYVVNSVLDHSPRLLGIHQNARPNAATEYLLIFTAAALLIGFTSIVLGFITTARRNHAIRGGAFSLSVAATILYMLSVGFGAKQTQLKGEGSVPKAIFAIDIVLVVTGLLYSVVLYMGMTHDGPAGITTGHHEHAPAGVGYGVNKV